MKDSLKIKKIFLLNSVAKAENNIFRKKFLEACKENNVEGEHINSKQCIISIKNKDDIQIIHNNRELETEQAFFFVKSRIVDSTFVYLLCELFRGKKIPFLDPINLSHSDATDKAAQMLKFTLSGIPCPPSIIFNKDSFIENKQYIYKNIQFPCVLKSTGSQGKSVWKINNKAELEEKVRELNTTLFVQAYVENTFDIRVLVFKNKIIGAMKRSSSDGFYNNFSRGGDVSPITITIAEKNLAKRVCKVSGLDYGGVDIVRTPQGPYVFEINKNPQTKGFTKTTGIDVPEFLVNEILND